MSAARSWLHRHTPTLAGSACALAVAPAYDTQRILEIAFVVVFVVLSLSLHEAAHAWTAWKCGDSTAKDLGRVTLNPLPSIDPFLTILLPLAMVFAGLPAFGGARPVPVDPRRLRHPLRDMMLVAIAGPATNFLLAMVFLVGLKAAFHFGDYVSGDLLPTVLLYTTIANLALAAFNMLPVPPLDGSRVMAWILPASLREPYVYLERFGLLVIMAVLWLVPGVDRLVGHGVDQMLSAIDFLTGGAW